ncbi:hypothetical protein [uncultured Phascolarctobacterium sp.]|uniref:hypothetical protein n=1 Tax=uncultured Phascolarctobacterium sp. TaxID=512296 RepID=UPI0026285597|nr:hypothetical protein [uncultured Phascolarctobacterium sp.]
MWQRNKINQRGTILLETLAVMAALILLGTFTFVQSEAVWRQYYKEQVRLTAQFLAGDLRKLQQQALFQGDTVTRTLRINSSNKSAYGLYERTILAQRKYFADYNCGDVYIQSGIASVGFSINGAPSANGVYILCHKKLAKYSCRVEVQPITGRVLIDEVQ